MRKILVTGGSGQLAQAIKYVAQRHDVEVYAPTHEECDICDPESIERAMQGVDVVVNAAAYTNVDGAESNPTEAHMVNSVGAANVANIAAKCGVKVIHISTDYVFGGDDKRQTPYSESECTNPINVYGETKAEGEAEVVKLGGIVLRTSWLYSPWCKNFCLTILRNAKTRTELRVVDDQRGTPTSALSLARCIVALIESGDYLNMDGVYHYADRGEASWYEFAREIVAVAGIEGCTIAPCTSDEWPTAARRPRYSTLNTERMAAISGVEMRDWREALNEVITIIGQGDDI
jgi:dTDP-4-dehydrorhamnose reductase